MNKVKIIFLGALSLSVLLPYSVRGQLIWKIKDTHITGSIGVDFTAIACWRNVCVVAGIEMDSLPPNSWLIFERSTDAGETWTKYRQPDSLGNFNFTSYYISKLQQIDSLTAIARADSGLNGP